MKAASTNSSSLQPKMREKAGLTRFEERDRIEGESLEFHERVRSMFLRLAAGHPEHYLVVDARRPVEEVEAAIRERVEPLLDGAVRSGGTRVLPTLEEGRS